jgi:predicted MPP superfamily phosphohydrolase
MRRINRRHFIAGLGLTAGAALANGFVIEPRRLTVTHHRLGTASEQSDAAPLRLVQLTDLHLQRASAHTRRIARTVNDLAPHIVLLTGDIIDRADRLPELATFLRLLDSGPAKLATLGNWEHWSRVDIAELTATYANGECRLLVNQTVRLQHEGTEILVTGLDDWTAGKPDLDAALRNIAPAQGHILLAHSPVQRDLLGEAAGRAALARYATECVLSGHTHGGQIALFGWAPVRPAGSGAYVAGWYRDAWPPLYVSRGLGTSLLPVRFGAPPEIACFDWNVQPR